MGRLDVKYVRAQFPALSDERIFMDNAGGTQVARQVGERIQDYLYNTNAQVGATYETSKQSTERVAEAQQIWAEVLNAGDLSEIVFGSSATMLLQNLSRSLVQLFQPGDEVIVTNCGHEANIGPWLMMQKQGIVVKAWEINRETLHLEMEDLEKLITPKTRLVAFTHVSNILGTINPVKEIAEMVHGHGAMVCVDGVACAPHRLPDMQSLGIDFYVFSLYKVFGPHYSLHYIKKDILDKLPGINHFFIEESPYKLQPGNVNFELTYGSLGILDYFKDVNAKSGNTSLAGLREQVSSVYEMISLYEEDLALMLLNFLKKKHGVRIIGEKTADWRMRVPTISFVVEDMKSSEIPLKVDPHQVGIRFGDFYARRLIGFLGLDSHDGVVRVSMVHYNTAREVEKLIDIFNDIF